VEEEQFRFVKTTTEVVADSKSITLADGRICDADDPSVVFLCAANNATVDSRQSFRRPMDNGLLKLVKQFKFSDPTSHTGVSLDFVRDWHRQCVLQFKEISKRCTIIFVLVTNRRVTGTSEELQTFLDGHQDVIVVDQSLMDSYIPLSLRHLVLDLDFDDWVQCETCAEWRQVPMEHRESVFRASRWTCRNATWTIFSCGSSN